MGRVNGQYRQRKRNDCSHFSLTFHSTLIQLMVRKRMHSVTGRDALHTPTIEQGAGLSISSSLSTIRHIVWQECYLPLSLSLPFSPPSLPFHSPSSASTTTTSSSFLLLHLLIFFLPFLLFLSSNPFPPPLLPFLPRLLPPSPSSPPPLPPPSLPPSASARTQH